MPLPIIAPNDPSIPEAQRVPLLPTGFLEGINRPINPKEPNGIARSRLQQRALEGDLGLELKASRRIAKLSWANFVKNWKTAKKLNLPLPLWPNDISIVYEDDIPVELSEALITQDNSDIVTQLDQQITVES